MAYMLRRQDGFRLFKDDGRVDIDSNLIKRHPQPGLEPLQCTLRGPRRGRPEFGPLRQPDRHLQDEGRRAMCLEARSGHLASDIDALMPWAYAQQGDSA
jgi:transposase